MNVSVSYIKTALTWEANDDASRKALLVGINYVNMEKVDFFDFYQIIYLFLFLFVYYFFVFFIDYSLH